MTTLENYEKATTNSDHEAIKKFLLDIDCINALKPWASKINLFDVLKITRTEIRHSNILSWLLDANESHGLNDIFIRGVIHKVVQNNQSYFDYKNINVLELLTMDYTHFTLYREWNNIDILLISNNDKVVICIENKIGSSEHDNQLLRYQEKIESIYPSEQKYKNIYIYLTPANELPSDADNWITFSYVDILEILKCISLNELDVRVSIIIENYIEVLRRSIVKDKELEEICINIYKKHKQALDLIYENIPDSDNALGDIINDYLEERASINKDIIYNSKNSTKTIKRFSLQTFDEIFPAISGAPGNWGNGINYFWEIKGDFALGKVKILFTMCNFEKYNEGKTSKLAKLLNIDLKDIWQWKTFESFNMLSLNANQLDEFFEKDYDEIKRDVYTKLDKAMEKVLNYEKKILELWNQ